jgi:hypothetical protein
MSWSCSAINSSTRAAAQSPVVALTIRFGRPASSKRHDQRPILRHVAELADEPGRLIGLHDAVLGTVGVEPDDRHERRAKRPVGVRLDHRGALDVPHVRRMGRRRRASRSGAAPLPLCQNGDAASFSIDA